MASSRLIAFLGGLFLALAATFLGPTEAAHCTYCFGKCLDSSECSEGCVCAGFGAGKRCLQGG